MFKRKKNVSVDNFSDLISENSTVDGDVSFKGTMRVSGSVNGNNLNGEGTLFVDQKGTVNSTAVEVDDAVISGWVKSKELKARGTLRITSTARVIDVALHYMEIHIEPGALVTGCTMQSLLTAEESKSDPLAPSAV